MNGRKHEITGATGQIAQFVAKAQYEDFPLEVISYAKRVLLDTLGCAIGAVNTNLGRIVQQFTHKKAESPEATVIGTEQRSSALLATYANSRLANILDFDDTFMATGHHANAALASALSACETLGRDGKSLITAFIVGFEVGARIAQYARPHLELNAEGKAMYWTGLGGPAIGVFASCAASAFGFELNCSQVEEAFGIASNYIPVQTSPSIWPNHYELPTIKYEDAGWNAHAGLMGTLMAKAGITGIPKILDGATGLSSLAHWKSPDLSALTEGLGEKWWISNTSLKPWPCCRWIHYSLTAFDNLLRREKISPLEIKTVCFNTFPPFQESDAFQRQDMNSNLVNISFSYPHAGAMLAFGVEPGLDWFRDEVVNSHEAISFRNRICTGSYPKSQDPGAWGLEDGVVKVPSQCVIETIDDEYIGTTQYALGDPWISATKLSDEEIFSKFIRLARTRVPNSTSWEEQIKEIIDWVLNIEKISSPVAFMELLSPRNYPP